MTNIKYRILLSALLLIPAITFSQEIDDQYYTGYIVENSGDTIPGRLLRKNKYLNPQEVSFNVNGSDQQFTQDDILAFYINELDLLFESYTITKNQDSNTKIPVDGGVEGGVEKGKHFLLTIAKTKEYGFYSFLDKGGVNRLYYRSDNKLHELLLLKRYTYTEDIRRVDERKTYVRQLLRFLIDCPAIKEKINAASYSSKSLGNILLAYAKCKGDEVTYQPQKKQQDVDFGFTLGIGRVTVADPGESAKGGASNNRISSSQFEKGNWFELGLAIRVKPKRDERFVYRGELKIRTQNAETSWSRDVPVTNLVTEASYNFKNTHLSFHFLTNANLSRWENGAFFFEGGIYLAHSLAGKIEIINGRTLPSGELSFRDDSLDINIRKRDIGITAGFGLEINEFAASLRYNVSIGDEASEERSITLRVTAISLNFTYLLWRKTE